MTIPGIQLYSVREYLGAEASSTIEKLAQLGFSRAEGFDLTQLKTVKPLLNDFGIQTNSSFLFWSHVTENHQLAHDINYPWIPPKWGIDYEIEQAHDLGIENLVIGYLLPQERQTLDDYHRLIEKFNSAGEACKKAGLSLLYHNHAFEFDPTLGVVPFELMMNELDPGYVNFELDVLWCELAGFSAVKLLETYSSRIKQLHFKSCHATSKPLYDDQILPHENHDCPLDRGVVDILAIANCFKGDISNATFIEQEYSDDMFASLAQSLTLFHNKG